MTAQDKDALLDLADAADIGFKIVEMCDRVRDGVKLTGIKGMRANWALEMDGVEYDVAVTLRRPTP